MPTRKPYTAKDVSQMTGCTHRQLQYWEQKKYIHPVLGSRNVRFFSDRDIETIRKIISLKHKGQSLGEAVFKAKHEDIFDRARLSREQVTAEKQQAEWLRLNSELLAVVGQVFAYEQKIPRFPYSVYSPDDLEKLKQLQEQASALHKQRNQIVLEEEKSVTVNQEELPIQPSSEQQAQEHVEVDKLIYVEEKKSVPVSLTIDQLVILWIKENNETNFSKARDMIQLKIMAGKTPNDIYNEIFTNS